TPTPSATAAASPSATAARAARARPACSAAARRPPPWSSPSRSSTRWRTCAVTSTDTTQGLRSLRVLARLLDYPSAELQAAAEDLATLLLDETRLQASLRQRLADWCRHLAGRELLDLQAEYVELFDRGRATSDLTSTDTTQGLRSLRVLARLLDYPSAELQAAAEDLATLLLDETRLQASLRQRLADWCRHLAGRELLDLQAEYVELFDRGRATSLLLFEHVHGESRDRGQAMVDLLAEYEAAGFQLAARELPDHLPLFLEYLSTRDEAEIGRWLGEISHILALLAARLEERNAEHALVPKALLA